MTLSKIDEKKSRVLMAKAAIPHTKLLDKFIEHFGDKYGEEDRHAIKLLFLLRKIDDDILNDLETWSKTFN